MDFAKKLLIKYGWQEGQGIGKNANGILKPIRANLKFDQAGLSFDKASEFTDRWWEKAFDNAAKNLNVNNSSKNTSFSVNESKEVSANGLPVKDLTFGNYDGFFQKGNPKVEHDSESIEYETEAKCGPSIFIEPLGDEDLLRACGGRTAHKGARHGLSLSGKLSRIDAQEKQLLENNELCTENAQNVFQAWTLIKSKKRKSKSSKRNRTHIDEKKNIPNPNDTMCSAHVDDANKLADLINQEDYQFKAMSKKKKKQQRERDEDLANLLSHLTTSNNVVDAHSAKFCSVHSSSKAIKKVKHQSKKHRSRKNNEKLKSMNKDKNSNAKEFERNNGKNSFKCYQVNCSSSDDSKKDVIDNDDDGETDPLVFQIKNIMNEYPNKKFKVQAEKLTPFQKKQLKKSGLRIELKSQKHKNNKRFKERVQVKKIIKKIEQSMDLGNTKVNTK